jgi:hypothetical protein
MKNYRINIIDAIKSINPDAQIILDSIEKKVATDSDVDACVFEWLEGTTPISKADIKTKLAELKAEYATKDYARKRKAEYPSIEDCVHAILDDTLDELQILRQAVKSKYLKP